MVLAMLFDSDPTIDNKEINDVMQSLAPSGASYRNIIHYAQLNDQKTETFQRYDYDSSEENTKHYGQPTPPQYDLGLLDFPIAIFGGTKDLMADPKDVEWTYNQMKKSVVYYHEYDLGHMSFIIAKNMTWFTEDAVAILNHHNAKHSD